jgi:hypothetical protein
MMQKDGSDGKKPLRGIDTYLSLMSSVAHTPNQLEMCTPGHKCGRAFQLMERLSPAWDIGVAKPVSLDARAPASA